MHHVITHRCGNPSCDMCHDRPGHKPKLMIVGHGRHGKDTVAEMLSKAHGYRFTSSSMWCAEKIMWPLLKNRYSSVEECFADRHNHRALWYDKIVEFNTPDKASLAREILRENDIYVGIRDWRELYAAKNANLVDFTIWVDATRRLPREDASSMNIEPWMADYILDNNGSFVDLQHNVRLLTWHIARRAQ